MRKSKANDNLVNAEQASTIVVFSTKMNIKKTNQINSQLNHVRNKNTSNASLTKKTCFYGTAVLIERVVGFLILSILTKNLSQEAYGIWTQIIVTTGLLSPIILFGFPTAAVKFLAGIEDHRDASQIFHAMLGIIFINSLVAIILTFLFAPSLSSLIFGSIRFSAFIPLFGLFLVSESLFGLITAFLRSRNEIRLLSYYYILKNGIRIILLTIGILIFESDLYQALISIIIFQIIITIFIYFKDIFKKVGFNISMLDIPWKEIVVFSLPLVPYSILIWANNFADRYLIMHFLDIKQLSIYAVAYSFAGIPGLFYSIQGYTMYPHVAQRWNNGDKTGAAETLCRTTAYYMFFTLPFIAILTIFSNPIIKIFSTSEYISSWQVVFWLSAGIGIFGLYQLNIYGILLANKIILNLLLSAAALLGNIILNIILIPTLGISGAAIATFSSNSILVIFTIRINKRFLPYLFPWRIVIKIILATAAMSMFVLIIKQYVEINKFWLLILLISFAGGIYAAIDLLNKKSILLQIRRSL